MLNFSKSNLKQLVGCFLMYLLASTILIGQEKKTVPNIEKVYIHTDRTIYTIGESLWYKAYSVYAYNNLLYNSSNVLYVELIAPNSKIIARNKTKLEGGLGHGDFDLTDSLGVKAGIYQLRAYTNYSRNFDTDFVFKKDIEIVDVFEKSVANKNKLDKPKSEVSSTLQELKNVFNVQFFPEGGSLINDVESTVAFKATNANGNPTDVKGKILDSQGVLVALFITNHDGMGKFQFKPEKGKQYIAQITNANDVLIEEKLPNALENGYVLSFKKIADKDILTIKTNSETLLQQLNTPLSIIGTMRGISYFETTQNLSKTSLSFQFPKSNFPDGISQITLYDANSKPQSERLFFIENEHDVEVNLSTDKKIYKPSEKVTINVSSKTKEGAVLPASFSISSTDTNGVKNAKDYATNISSYFLMESDIRGNVFNPSYYFDKSNPKRLEHLDLLLLTQGWRDFLWKTLPEVKDSIRFPIENNFVISGRLKQLLSNKPKANSTISLALMNKTGLNMSNAITDANGIYKFDDVSFFGETSLFLNSRNEKGKNSGEILMNSFETTPMKVDIKKQTTVLNEDVTMALKENIYKKYVLYGIAPENILDEVEIIAKKKNTTPSLYGMPDYSYVADDEALTFNDIYQLIQYKIPGVIVDGTSIRFMRFNEPAHIILDGFPVNDSSQIDFILPDNVEKIDAVKGPSAAIFGAVGANGVIAIYTKPGVPNTSSKKVYHSISEKINGFYIARTFYTPSLDKLKAEPDSKFAVRNTLYWNPYAHPNEKGEFHTTYYNTDVETTVKVSLEGITASGIPVVVKTDYVIEK